MVDVDHFAADLSVSGQMFELAVLEADRVFIRYQQTEDGTGGAAVAEVREAIAPGDTPEAPSVAVPVALDGTVTEVDVSKMAYMSVWVTTARSGEHGMFHVYTREQVSEASSGGSSLPYDNAIAMEWEESGNFNTGTSSGFQWSVGNGDVGDYGSPIPYDFEVLAISVAALTNPAGNTVTVEVYKGTGGASSSATGISATIADGDNTAYNDSSGSPVTGSAGEWVVPKTTAKTGSGNINGGRVVIWIRPR